MGELVGLLDQDEFQRSVRLAHLHGRSLRQREIDRFRELGVRAIDLGSPSMVLADRVVFDGEFFTFANDAEMIGEPAFTIAVISNAGTDWFYLDWVRVEQVLPATYSNNWQALPEAIGLRGARESLLYFLAPGAAFPAARISPNSASRP